LADGRNIHSLKLSVALSHPSDAIFLTEVISRDLFVQRNSAHARQSELNKREQGPRRNTELELRPDIDISIDQVFSYCNQVHIQNVNIGRQIFWRPKPRDLFDQPHRVANQDRQFK
jgi:hypothetical protein